MEMLRKRNLLILIGLLALPTSVVAQKSALEAQFGVNVIKPRSAGYSGKSEWSHNFWVGLDYKIKKTPHFAFHIGLFTNGVHYRFSSKDSPTVTFLSMNYISTPVQMQFMSEKTAFSFLVELEPKVNWKGFENTAMPVISRKIIFNKENMIYQKYNLGFRAGIGYKMGILNYFLQYSTDLMPFRSYKSEVFTDHKFIFGFTIIPIYQRK